MVPSAGNRRALLERGDADISFDLPNKDFVELKQPRRSSTSSDADRERHPVSRHERQEAAVRQRQGAAGGRLRDPVPEDHGRGAVRPANADVRRAGRGDRSRLAAADTVQHRHREGEAAAGRGRAIPNGFETTLSFDLGFAGRQRAALRAGAGEPRADRHQVHDQQDPRRQLAHRAEQEGAAALHQRVLRLARLSRSTSSSGAITARIRSSTR